MSEHDDLSEWRDDPLVRALRAPGSASELSGEREMVSAYRHAMPSRSVGRSVGRMVGRFGVGGTTVVTVVALSSGVAAAAYTQTLPESVQRIAHDVLGPIGVPPAHEHKVKAQPKITRTPSPTPTPTEPAPTPTASPGIPVATQSEKPRTVKPADDKPDKPKPTRSPDAVVPPAGPSPTPTPSPSPTPTPTPTPTDPPVVEHVKPASLSISVSGAMVSVGTTVTVSGAVAGEDGSALPNHRVALLGRTPGHPGWALLATGHTGEDGAVALSTPPLEHSLFLRLRTGNRVKSDPVRVAVVPTVGVSHADGILSVTTIGGQAGDTVLLQRWRQGQLVRIARTELDASGSASFAVEPKKKQVRYVALLKGSKLHTPVEATIAVPGSPAE